MTDHQQQTNGPTDQDIRDAFHEILEFHEELDSERGSYMQRCRQIRERMSEVYDLAADKGIKKKVLRAKVKEHLLQQKIDGIAAELEDDDRSHFERISEALGEFGDSPLGQAALAAAKQRDRDTLDDLAH